MTLNFMDKNPYFLILFLLISTIIKGQSLEKDSINGKYFQSKIIKVDSLKKDLLFSKTLEWIAINYKSSNDVIQFSNLESGKIILKGSFSTSLFIKEGWIEHTLIIDFKDGRMKCSYSDFSYYSLGSGRINFESKNLGFRNKLLKETDENIVASINNLTAYLLKTNKNDDW